MKNLIRIIALVSLLLLSVYANAAEASIIEQLLNQGSISSKVVQIFLIITVLGLAPSIIVMVTSFVRIIVVLSMVRTAIGLQQTPPNQVLLSLALFLSFFIMTPVMEKAYNDGLRPMLDEKITEEEALPLIVNPFKKFMLENTRSKDLELFSGIAKIEITEKSQDMPIQVVIPSFMISELRRAFEIGFLLFLPFLIIDIVVSSILMAMGMMMMPPVTVSLPFKVIFFVMVDGWYILAGSLVKSFVT
jgi:flagellar biosynthetic protein FliP